MSRRRAPGDSASSGTTTWLLPLLAVVLVLALAAAYLLWQRRAAPAPPAPDAASGLEWEVAFTTPLIPDNPARHSGGIDERLVALMDRATRTLDVASYELDLPNVAEAMARAARRGVRVRMVTDTDTVEKVRDEKTQGALRVVREAGVPVVDDSRGAIMHHKFTVVDGEWVQTGSWNYTDGDTYRLNNNQAIFRSRELAANFTAEFEKLFVQRRFGPSKAASVPHPVVQVGGLRVETYFAPQDRVSARIVERIGQAQRRVRFLAFSFTHDAVGQAMLARHQAGVEVQGVFETTGSNTQFSEFNRLRQAGVEVFQDGSPYVMHHKVIVLDDRVTLFGSFNFSDGADRENDENLLVVEGADFAARFEEEFQRMLALARNPPARK